LVTGSHWTNTHKCSQCILYSQHRCTVPIDP